MKRKALALFMACFMLAGCTQTPTGSETTDTTKTETESTLFVGYNKVTDIMWGTNESYVVNKNGKKIIDMSENYKYVFDIDGKEYAFEREVGEITENVEYGFYENFWNYVIYDEDGNKVGEINDVSNANYISDGNFMTYNYRDNIFKMVNPFTGEEKETSFVEVVHKDDKPVGLMYQDENYRAAGYSDLNGENYIDLSGYSYCYQTGGFIVCVSEGENFVNRSTILNTKGEKVSDVEYENVIFDRMYLLGHVDGKTHVMDSETGKVIYEIDGKAQDIFEDGHYITSRERTEEEKGERDSRWVYSLFDKDGNLLSDGWDGYNSFYRSNASEYFVFYDYGKNYQNESYIVDLNGEIVYGPITELHHWISEMGDDYFILTGYDSELNKNTLDVLDYDGNKIDLGKEYVGFQRQYNYDKYPDYFFAYYENPISQGYLYDILDMDLNVLYTGFNSIQAGGNSTTVFSAAKGFDIGLFDVATGEWIYKERSFNSLND